VKDGFGENLVYQSFPLVAHSVSYCVTKPCPELGAKPTSRLSIRTSQFDPEETSPGRGTSRGEIRDPLLSDADRFYRGGSSFSAKSSPISIRWSLNLERTLRHL
jgi:hypothetical protein